MHIKVLNKKETNRLLEKINERFGSEFQSELGFFLNREDLYMANRECFENTQPSWRINSLGLYLGEYKNDEFRPSIEGSQLIGKTAKDNILELDEVQIAQWLQGEHFEIKQENSGFLLIKFNGDFFGSGKIKNERMLNFVPKERRVSTIS